MKKQKLLRNLNSKGRYLTLLLTVTAGLLYCSSAWADVELSFTEADFYFSSSRENGIRMHSGYMTHNAQTVTSFTLTAFHGWLKQNADELNQEGKLSYNVYNTDSGKWKWGDWYDINYNEFKWNDWKDSWRYPEFKYENMSHNVISTAELGPGNYQLQALIKAQKKGGEWFNSTGSNFVVSFTVPGWSTTSGSATIGSSPVGIPVTKSNISLGTHYGSNDNVTTSINGANKDDFTVTSVDADKITVKFTPSAVGERTATITITDKYGKTRTLTVTGTGNNTPTVLIAGKETVLDTEVTLNGYIKYTGCQNVTEYGFVYGLDEGGEPTYDQQAIAGTTGAEAGYSYSKSFEVMDNGTYNYRAYMIAGGTTYYSTEVRQFTIESDCPYYPSPRPELTLNGYVDNVICLDESVVAKCVSKPGFTYALYGPDGNIIGQERGGDGSTFVWQKNDALKNDGQYIVKTKKEGTDCWAITAKATQAINSATMTIEAENDNPYAYQPVMIMKSADQDEFTKPTWTITTAESGAYLLNYENKLIYSGKQVDKVLFKGNATDVAKQVEVSAAAYKTVEFEGGEKTCPAVVEPITITVKPADEVCDE